MKNATQSSKGSLRSHALMLSITASLMAGAAKAQSLEIGGELAYGGTGCPDGSVSLVTNPENPALVSIALNSFKLEAGGSTGKSIDRKACGLTIPLRVPQGFRVALVPPKVSGRLRISKSATARLSLEAFIAGSSGNVLTKTIKGPVNAPLVFDPNPTSDKLDWSSCGKDVNLRANLSLLLMASSSRRSTAVINRLGGDNGLLEIVLEKCE
jgi:hypothetical protein